METLPFENIASYKFVDLETEWLADRRPLLLEECRTLGLRGTILLSTEGINVFLSGLRSDVRSFQEMMRGIEPFADLTYKASFTSEHSFRRLLVKIKEEIIPFGIPTIKPAQHSTKRIMPLELKQWLDAGRDVVLLDTRNDYEVELGTFHNAIDLNLKQFRNFPAHVLELDDSLRARPIVTFCTGGIRCEKAAPLMVDLGFKNVFQLEGGILGYFSECGGDHWHGECFVFDGRVAVDAELKETDTEFCFRCQHILSPADLANARYVVGVSCPYCVVAEHVTPVT